VAVPNIAVRIQIARLKHQPPLRIPHQHPQEDQPLGVESRGNAVTVGSVPDLDAEFQSAPRIGPSD
jgi:hypothetical protein